MKDLSSWLCSCVVVSLLFVPVWRLEWESGILNSNVSDDHCLFIYFVGMEYVGPSKRVWAGCIIHVFGTNGAMYLVLMAYLWRDWQKVQLSMGVPCIIYVVLIW